ncbi:MAG: matrixin family metalloprotease [Pseudomonadota bacterium]
MVSEGYTLNNRKWGQDAMGTASGEITWSINMAGLVLNTSRFPNQTLADFEQALFDAFDAWAAVAQLTFRQVADGAAADVTMSFTSENVGGFNLGTPFGTVGLASSFFNGGPVSNGLGIMQSGRIFFDAAETWVASGNAPNAVSFLGVALHEIGHVLGLGHFDGNMQVMNSRLSTDQLQAGDIAGIQQIYGARLTGTNDSDVQNLGNGTAGAAFDAGAGDDAITGSMGADRITGGAGDDDLMGRDGNDILIDTSGENEIFGGADDDMIVGGRGVLRAEGDSGRDQLIGGIGADTLNGGAGDDVLRGDPYSGFLFGNDVLEGGTGDDLLEGGGGADVFVFRRNDGIDQIGSLQILGNNAIVTGQDFEVGVDRIDLQDFGFASFAEVTQVMATLDGNTVFDADGTFFTIFGVAEDQLTAGDFIL